MIIPDADQTLGFVDIQCLQCSGVFIDFFLIALLLRLDLGFSCIQRFFEFDLSLQLTKIKLAFIELTQFGNNDLFQLFGWDKGARTRIL